MSKGNEGNTERELEAEAKQALRTSLYTSDTFRMLGLVFDNLYYVHICLGVTSKLRTQAMEHVKKLRIQI
jgi:hypothetical protein